MQYYLTRRQIFTAGQAMGQRAAVLLVVCMAALLDANYGFLMKLLLPKPIYTLGMPRFLFLQILYQIVKLEYY